MPNRLPVPAIALGLSGLIPFLACGAGALLLPDEWARRSLFSLTTYAACILSFLGAVHWGFALGAGSAVPPGGFRAVPMQPSSVLYARLGLGVLPALVAWIALLVAFFGLPSAALGTLAAGFIATIIVETHANQRGLLPPGYIWLRWLLSGVVIVVLVIVALVRSLGQHANF